MKCFCSSSPVWFQIPSSCSSCPVWSPGCSAVTHLCSSISRSKPRWWTVACVRAPKAAGDNSIFKYNLQVCQSEKSDFCIYLFIWNKSSPREFACMWQWQAAWSNGSATVTVLRWNKRLCTGGMLGWALLLNLFWTHTRKSTFIMLLCKVNIKMGHSWYGCYNVPLQKRKSLCLVFFCAWDKLSKIHVLEL